MLATVSAQTGAARIYLRPGSDALASSWAAVAGGVVEPATSMPDAVWRAAPYPLELFRVQARRIEQSARTIGTAGGRAGTDLAELPRADMVWARDTTGPLLTMPYERQGERRLGAILIGSHDEESDVLRLTRFDSAMALPSRGALESRWARFPSYDALSDSIRDDGGRLERGPVRFDVGPDGLLAYQSHFAGPATGRVSLVWVTVAAGDRQGAGHDLKQAWSNLLGASVPALAGTGPIHPAGRRATADPARRLRAPRCRLGSVWARVDRPASRARPAAGFDRAMSLLARGAGTTFGGFCPGAGA